MELKIEGKLRDGFFEWLDEVYPDISGWIGNVELFMILPQSAQFGLIQEYADTLGVYIKASKSLSGYSYNVTRTLKHFQSFRSDTLQEAQVSAIKKLNEIVNIKVCS